MDSNCLTTICFPSEAGELGWMRKLGEGPSHPGQLRRAASHDLGARETDLGRRSNLIRSAGKENREMRTTIVVGTQSHMTAEQTVKFNLSVTYYFIVHLSLPQKHLAGTCLEYQVPQCYKPT